MATCYISLGSNLGQRHRLLDEAVRLLDDSARVRVVQVSRYVETEPVGGPEGQPAYLNAAARLETTLSPGGLLGRLHEVEGRLGRVRTDRWGPRTIDLDLVLFEDRVLRTPALTVPHPRMHLRRFVLEPLAEIASGAVHPLMDTSVGGLLSRLGRHPHYLALAGLIGAGKTSLGRAFAGALGARSILETLDEQQLASFYDDPAGRGLSMQLEFLRQRTRALDESGLSAGKGWVVSDFWFDQSLVFSKVLLAEPNRRRYRDLWAEARAKVLDPTVVVWLDVPTELLLERIRRRGRAYESRIDREYLDRLGEAYQEHLEASKSVPLYRVDAARPAEVLDELLAVVRGAGD